MADSLARTQLIEAIKQEGQLSSTSTVMFHALVGQRLGLGPSDHKCADIVFRVGAMTAGELAARTGLTTGAVTGILDRLEHGGFIKRERDPQDRRRVIVDVIRDSPRIREVSAMFAPLANGIRELAAEFTDQELATILSYLVRSRALVDREAARLRADA